MPASPRRHLSVDELSQRASTGLAIRRGDIKISDPIPSSYVHNGAEMDGAFEQPTPISESAWPRKSGTGMMHGKDNSTLQPRHVSKFTERTSVGPSLAASNMSSPLSKDSGSQRRNTGLRATIKRMLSSKRHTSTPVRKMTNSQSDPGRILSVTGPQSSSDLHSFSIQRNLISPSRALHSHAPSPHLRVESVDILREQPSIDQLGQRRNTVPSLMLIAPQEQTQPTQRPAKEPLSPQRPTTAAKRQTPPPTQFKRRSRSADDLAETVRAQKRTSDRRDRAEEIAYWRNSVVVDPLPDRYQNHYKNDVQAVADEEDQSEHAEPRPRPSFEPIQHFDFGLQKASVLHQPNTLLDRVNTLEVKLFDFEFALSKLQGSDVTMPHPYTQPIRPKSGRGISHESGQSSNQEESCSSNERSHLSSPSEQWRSSPRVHSRPDRTSKATTIKPYHRRMPSSRSEMSSPASIHFSREQYDALRNLINDEKTARQNLELQVMNLQKEVDILKSPVYAYVRPVEYPTPSPDSFHEPTRYTPRLLHRSPPLRPERDLNETSRFSMTETEDETENEDPYIEVYETPQQQNFQFEPRRISPSGMI